MRCGRAALESGGGCVGRGVLLRRLGEAFAELAELTHLLGAELGEALTHVLQRLVEPIRLMLGSGVDDSTPHDVLKELVPRLLERRWSRGCFGRTCLLFGHVG